MTQDEVLAELKTDSLFNKARREFSSASAKIEQASQQRTSLAPVDMRRMEFKAVEKILAIYGVKVK